VVIGTDNFQDNASFNRNIAIGYNNGNNGWDSSNNNIIVGNNIGTNYGGSYNTYSSHNVILGNYAFAYKSGSGNIVMGNRAMFDNSSSGCNKNVSIGEYTLRNCTSGANSNIAIGEYSGAKVTSGNNNTFVGANTNNNSTSGTTTGSNNTAIGSSATSSSKTVSNEITLGNSSITSLRCAVTSITSLSDERDKSEIEDLSYGLAFIDALQPREFVWDNRAETRTVVSLDENGVPLEDENGEQITETQEFYSANKGKKDFGFIAQEVRELDNDTLRLVYSENEEKLEMSYGKLVPILVKAIQELKEEVEILKSQK